MKNRFSVFDGEIYDSTAGLIFADGESVYRATPVKDDDLTLLKEIIRRANAFEPGGEVERLRAALEEFLKNHDESWARLLLQKDSKNTPCRCDTCEAARAALAQEPAHAKA